MCLVGVVGVFCLIKIPFKRYDALHCTSAHFLVSALARLVLVYGQYIVFIQRYLCTISLRSEAASWDRTMGRMRSTRPVTGR